MTVRENIAAGKYENNVPGRIERVPVDENMTIRQARDHKDAEVRRSAEQRIKNQTEHSRIVKLFRADLEDEYGIAGNPKAALLWEKAWDRGHSGGWSEIVCAYDDLAELIT